MTGDTPNAPGRRSILGAAAGLAAGPALAQAPAPAPAPASNWPSRPIRWILGFAPGGAGDITARLMAPRLQALLGQPVLIENRPSAGGIVAAEAVARSAPDGHTLLLVTSTSSTAVAFYRTLPFDTERDFAPVGLISTFGHVLLTGPNAPYRNLTDVIAAARARPGSVNIASIGVGTAQHLSAELFRVMSGIETVTVTYRSTPDLLNAVAAGEVQLAFETLPPVVGQLGPGARMRALAISSAARFPGLPDVPTAEEAGLPGYLAGSWNGVQAPARTPPEIVARLNAAINQVVAEPEIRARLLEMGLQPSAGAPDALQARLLGDIALWNRVVAEAKIERQ
ncbi:tripartite tricarboxylate transporter substrate binding protein [Roseomonas nepalensis]|uniref:Tripartite tricarboxylate transporter substrate binding protein n=1 Tax=Muricoccus nepalensis TaxID=1854500 RepID=A0A502GC18_9PROT|nr:tripartite tricarboxylate transporter substrate binding protein [Roseomonas nepalensis]TPG59639.1 tripartite tricarboxylate transporter substrate binding protein [Roseomonas nepalensis]